MLTKVVDTWTRPTLGALRNAREATVSLANAVADRLTLTADLEIDGDDGPGELHAMTREECYDALRKGTLGRLAYVARAGTPDIVPVNYVVDGNDILIRSGPGPKLQAAERGEVVAFEVDDVDPGTQTGRSVVATGRAIRLRPAEVKRVEELTADLPWAAGPRRHVIRIRPTRVSGRRLS